MSVEGGLVSATISASLQLVYPVVDPTNGPQTRVASLRCTNPLKVSFQYNYTKADSMVLVSICGRLIRSTFQYISKLIPTISPGDLPCHRQWREPTVALWARPGSRFAGGGGAAGNARQPFRGGRRHWLCRQSALWLEPIFISSTYVQFCMGKWKATMNTWCTRCIFIVCRSMVCIHAVKVSGV